MKAGLVMATLGLFLASIASEPVSLATGLILAGLGGAFLWIPAPVIAADALPKDKRHLAVGLLGSGIGLGIVFVSTLSGWLRDIEGERNKSAELIFNITINPINDPPYFINETRNLTASEGVFFEHNFSFFKYGKQ